VIFTVLASFYFFSFAVSGDKWNFLSIFNLFFHEAGHVIFIFFGQFIHIIGGSLTQVLIPTIVIYSFWHKGYNYAAAFFSFWLGQNLIEVAHYAGDAQKMQLELLGGQDVIHDWNYLLTKTGLLPLTDVIAGVIYTLGLVTMFAALFGCVYILHKRHEYHV